MLLIFILAITLCSNTVFAQEAGFLDEPIEKIESQKEAVEEIKDVKGMSEVTKEESVDVKQASVVMDLAVVDEMESYLKEEDRRLKAIKLLSLDLEKSNIELKQREVQVKMAQLNEVTGLSQVARSNGQEVGTDGQEEILALISIMKAGDIKEATIQINGENRVFCEGQAVGDYTLKEISANKVVLINQDKEEKHLTL